MPNKRKHKTLTLKDKLAILNMLDNGEAMSEIAQRFEIGRSTIYDIKLRRAKIMQYANISEDRKTLKFGKYPELDSALYDWFLEERVKHNTVSGDILKEKAKEIYLKMTGNEFKASSGWLDKFKKRFGIKFNVSAVSGEKSSFISRDEDAVDKFIQSFKEKVEQLGLNADQLYCTDATALLWRVLKKNTDVLNEDIITFMPCSNATGTHKLDLLVIGKKPLEVFNVVPFPVTYKHQPNHWLTKEIFTEWFHDEFVPNVRLFMRMNNLPEKALLVLDESPGYPEEYHLKSNDWMIQAMFLPVVHSPWIQPMDKNIMQVIKDSYKKKIILDSVSKGGDIKSNLMNLNLNNAILALLDSWKCLSSKDIRTSWMKLYSDINVSEEGNDDDIHLDNLLMAFRGSDIKEKDVRDWLAGNITKISVATEGDVHNETVITIKPEDPLTFSRSDEETEQLTILHVAIKKEYGQDN